MVWKFLKIGLLVLAVLFVLSLRIYQLPIAIMLGFLVYLGYLGFKWAVK
jgi:hypothetical protein